MDGQGIADGWQTVPKHMFSRLLYCNPVCLLTTVNAQLQQANVMTISWLTPADNNGTVLLSMNAKRHSATLLQASKNFVLSVPVLAMRELVRRIGGCTGATEDKFDMLTIRVCRPGGMPLGSDHLFHKRRRPGAATAFSNSETAECIEGSVSVDAASVPGRSAKRRNASTNPALENSIAIADCCAHIVCTVTKIDTLPGHLLIIAQITSGFVRDGYWNGKNFAPTSAGLSPYMSFMGSQQFAAVTPVFDDLGNDAGGESSTTATT